MANTPEIKIGADMSAAEKAVEQFGKKLDAAAKPRKVDLDTSPAEKALDDLGKKGQTADKATALPGAAVGIKNVAEELKKVGKLQADLAKAGIKASQDQAKAARDQFAKWRDSGARGTRGLKGHDLDSFVGGAWRDSALSEADARRRRNQVLSAVGLSGDRPGGRSLGEFTRTALGRAGRGVAGQILPNGGIGGAIAKEGIAEGAGAGGLLSGAGLARMGVGLGVGALAFGAMKLVGGIKNSIGTAQDEGVNRSDLVRSVGGTVEDFNELRRSAQALAQGLDVTSGEATRLARAYAAGSGVGQNDRGRIYGEAGQAGSFARQTGLDVGTTVGQFSELRRNGQDSPERLGKSIADAMSKRGDFGRLSEVLGGLTSFVSNVTGSSLTKANTGGVLDIASRLAALNLPGMGTAEGIGHAAAMDAGFRGGAGGEAGDLMIMQGLRRKGGRVNGYDVKSIREAGIFASMNDVFGEGSAPFKEASSRGDRGAMARYRGLAKIPGTTVEHMYSDLKGRYGEGSPEMVSAMSNFTNGNQGDAFALITALRNGKIKGSASKLKGLGIDTSKMSVGQLVQASGVLGASKEELAQRKQDMLGRTGADKLSAADEAALKSANDPEELRKVMANIASKETIKTDGEETRKSLSTLQQAVENVSAKLIEYLNPIREVLVRAAKAVHAINEDDADRLMGVSPIKKMERERAELEARLTQQQAPRVMRGRGGMFLGGGSTGSAAEIAETKAQLAANAQAMAAQALAEKGPGNPAAAEAGRKNIREPGPKDFTLSPADQAHSDAFEASTVDYNIKSIRAEMAKEKDPLVVAMYQKELDKQLAIKGGSSLLPGDAAPASSGAASSGASGGAARVVHVDITLKDQKGRAVSDPHRVTLNDDGRPTPNGVVAR